MATPPPNSFGSILRRYRSAALLSQEELAERSGVSCRAISDLERGVRQTARPETLRMLADGLQLSASERQVLAQVASAGSADKPSRDDQPVGARTRQLISLPKSGSPFVGRTMDLERISSLLRQAETQMVTITGPAGIGKTRLAIEIGQQLEHDFPDGVAFAGLETVTSADSVLAEVVHALGLPTHVTTPRQIGATLEDAQMLLIADNFEHVLEAAALLSELLAAAPNLTVLVTSRQPLSVSTEHHVPVSSMTVPELFATPEETLESESVRLFLAFADRAGRPVDPNADNLEALASICRRLDGFPLALRLAASRLRVLSVTELASHLERDLGLLGQGDRDLPIRQQTMQNAVEWSYRLLEPDQQKLFRWLCLFAGGFSLDAASFVANRAGLVGSGIDELSALADASLVRILQEQHGATRYRVYELPREFGLSMLQQHDEMAVAKRALLDYIDAYTQDGFISLNQRPSEAWLGRVRIEHSNLAAAVKFAFEDPVTVGSTQLLARVAAYWWENRMGKMGFPVARQLIDRIEGASASHIECCYWVSGLAHECADHLEALILAQRAESTAKELGDPAYMALALHSVGLAHQMLMNWPEAMAAYNTELKLLNQLDDRGLSAYAHWLASAVAWEMGDFGRSFELVHQAEEEFAQQEDLRGRASASSYLGFYYQSIGANTEAAAAFLSGFTSFHQAQRDVDCVKALFGLALIAARAGQAALAARLVGSVDEFLRRFEMVILRFDEEMRDEAIALVTADIGDVEFEHLRQEGRSIRESAWESIVSEIVRWDELPIVSSKIAIEPYS